MSRTDAIQQYRAALKAGQKYYNTLTAQKGNHLPILVADVRFRSWRLSRCPVRCLPPRDCVHNRKGT